MDDALSTFWHLFGVWRSSVESSLIWLLFPHPMHKCFQTNISHYNNLHFYRRFFPAQSLNAGKSYTFPSEKGYFAGKWYCFISPAKVGMLPANFYCRWQRVMFCRQYITVTGKDQISCRRHDLIAGIVHLIISPGRFSFAGGLNSPGKYFFPFAGT